MTDDTITIGFAYPEDQNEASSAIGAGDSDFADWGEVYEVMVAWVNANGGVNGRELVAYYRPFTAAEYGRGAAFYQALCTEFTQDQGVYAVGGLEEEENFLACLADAGVPTLSSRAVSALDAESAQQYRGFLYGTSSLDLTQHALLNAEGHVAMGHVTPDSIVGVITIDTPSYARAAEAFEAELGKHGIRVAETVLVTYPGDDLGSSAIASAVLRFRQQGVDRVAVFEINGVMWWEFTLAAEAQAYRPDYMLNSTSSGEYFANSGQMPTAQMEGSRGVGTFTIFQVHRDSEPYPPPGRAICRAIFDAAGIPQGSEDSEGIQLAGCENVVFAKAALDRAADLSPLGLQAAVESLGRTPESALTFGSYHGPGYHTGAGAYFTFAYVPECTCFRMTSDPLAMPGTPQ